MEFRSRVAGKGIAPDRQPKTTMTPDRWDEVEKRLHDAVQLAPADRAGFLDQIQDVDVRLEVGSLLAAGVARDSLRKVVRRAAREIPSPVGSALDHFQILRAIGHGGMGDVYLARDLKLGRQVAIKLLPPDFQQDAERLRFFEREARAAAALSHPNVMAVYEVGHCNGRSYIAAEYVEGDTLADRIRRGPLNARDAIPLAAQIAAGLAAAHETGIVHRDLKPANVKIRPDGVVKVLDFGLAKLSEAASPGVEQASSPAASPITLAGAVVGTPAYMAPEQARGMGVDKRADIWAFGVVLYEMLTSRSAFQRETMADTLAAVVGEEPDLSPLPARLRGVIARCLSKDPLKRWQDIRDVRLVLEDDQAPDAAGRPLAPVPWIISAVACIVALAASIGFLRTPGKPAPQPFVRLNVDLGPEARLLNDRGRHTIAVSPDGTRIAFSCEAPGGELRICTRKLDQTGVTALAGTEGVEKIFFSPDGQWIGYGARGKLKKVSVQGGASFVLADAPFDRGAAWGENGFIVASLMERTGLVRIPEGGGTPQPLTQLQSGENTHRWPQVLPGGRAVLFTANSQAGDYENASVDVFSVQTGQRRTLHRNGYYGRYLPSGHLVYMHQGTLFAAPMDPDRLVLTGPPTPVLDNIDSRPGDGGAAFDCSRSGVFLYQSGATQNESTVQWLEKSGELQPLMRMPSTYKEIRFSPDGRRLALVKDQGGNPDIWVYDMERGAMTRLTFGGANEGPVWNPGGQYLAYHSGQGLGMWWIRVDGSGGPQRLMESAKMQSATSFSGANLAFEQVSPTSDADLWTVSIEGAYADHPKAGAPEPFLRTSSAEGNAVFSPDGRWLAYTSDESGVSQVYVRPFRPDVPSESGSKTQASTEGGSSPMWSRTERELFYTSGDRRIMVVSYSTEGDSFLPNKPALWTQFEVMTPAATLHMARSSVDLAPDGKRFAVLVPANAEPLKPQTHINVLLNFFDELERRTRKNP
jgi:serine/threonine protein kinase/Tol biopolymer transport system component